MDAAQRIAKALADAEKLRVAAKLLNTRADALITEALNAARDLDHEQAKYSPVPPPCAN